MIALAPVLLKPTLAVAAAAWGVLLVEGELVGATVGSILLLLLVVTGLRRSANRGSRGEGFP